MTDDERKAARTWLRVNAFYHPEFGPENVNVANLVNHWFAAHKARERETWKDETHPIWALAREVAAETPPMMPYPPEVEAAHEEMSTLESRILHGKADDAARARYAELRKPYEAIVQEDLRAFRARLIALGEDPSEEVFRKNLSDHPQWDPGMLQLPKGEA